MGHQVKHIKNRLVLLTLILCFVVGLVYFARFLLVHSFYYNVFHYSSRNEQPLIVDVPRVKVDPKTRQANVEARAVPVIFYHGVIQNDQPDGVNTTRANFLSQMVALKQNGYYTITTQDMVDFYSGKKKLYGKPILISFDDGRVDSYVPTDDILKKLGFQAVFFIVSGKQDNYTDPFFLSWDRLAILNQSGRWDLQAHGWYSHTKIPIDTAGQKSNPLTNRKWLASQARLEAPQEASHRILNDYLQNIKDLHQHFPRHKIEAFAVPYGDYGQKDNNFVNFPGAKSLNYSICKTYFKICFDIDAQGYNFQEHDPLRTVRLGVAASWDGKELLRQLTQNAPRSPDFSLNLARNKAVVPVPVHLLGTQSQSANGLRLSSVSTTPANGYMNYDMGNQNNFDYDFTATYTVNQATSVYLSGDKYEDANNSQDVLFGMTADTAYLRVVTNGTTHDIASRTLPGFDAAASHTLQMKLHRNSVSCLVDGKQVLADNNLPLIEPRGTYGIDAYGPNGAVVTFQKFILKPTAL